MNDILNKVAEEFRNYYLEAGKIDKNDSLQQFYESIGTLNAGMAFENILTKHLIREINNDNDRINQLDNLLDTSDVTLDNREAIQREECLLP